jgi:putative transposase
MDMKRSRFTESQILGILEKLRAGESVAELCEEHRISASTLYGWRSRHRSLLPEDEGVLHRVKNENRRLRRIIIGMIEESDKLKGLIRSNQVNSSQLSNPDSQSDASRSSGENDSI